MTMWRREEVSGCQIEGNGAGKPTGSGIKDWKTKVFSQVQKKKKKKVPECLSVSEILLLPFDAWQNVYIGSMCKIWWRRWHCNTKEKKEKISRNQSLIFRTGRWHCSAQDSISTSLPYQNQTFQLCLIHIAIGCHVQVSCNSEPWPS